MLNTDFSGVNFIFDKLTELLKYIYFGYLSDFIEPNLFLIKGFLNVFSALVVAGIIVVFIKFREVVKKERETYAPIDMKEVESDERKIQWEIILNHLNSKNSSEWKIAIIEADNILDDILEDAGYMGETLADKLKAAGDNDIIQQAWEAHQVRNMIAHDLEVEVTEREAKRVINLYGNVFKRFNYI